MSAEKKQIRKNLKKFEQVKTWQLLALLLIMIVVTATFLRLNNVGMVQRREAVLSADEAGDGETIRARLYDLQVFVASHMNTSLGKGVYLEYSYRRDVQAAYAAVSNDQNPNGNIYKKAQEVCAPKFSGWSMAYVQCTANELAKYPSSSDLVSSINVPDSSLYLHSFAAPVWSPDFAGWSIIVCIAILTMIVIRLTTVMILKLLLKRHEPEI